MSSVNPAVIHRVALWRLHALAAVLSLPFLAVAVVTGLIYVPTPQVEAWQLRQLLSGTPVSQAPAMPLDELLQKIEPFSPEGTHLKDIVIPSEAGIAWRFQYTPHHSGRGDSPPKQSVQEATPGPSTKPDSQAHAHSAGPILVLVDAHQGRVLARMQDSERYGDWARRLHSRVLASEGWRWMIEWAATCLLVMVLSGAFLAWPRLWARGKGGWNEAARAGPAAEATPTPPPAVAKGLRVWHHWVGLGLALLSLGMVLTGLTWSQWSGQQVRAWRNWAEQGPPRAPAGLVSAPPGAGQQPLGAQEVLELARQKWPQGSLQITPPRQPLQPWRAAMVERSMPTQRGEVWLDAYSGATLWQSGWQQLPWFAKATAVGIPFHRGELGLWNQAVLVLFGIGVLASLGTGGIMGWRRWRRSGHWRPAWGASAWGQARRAGLWLSFLLLVFSPAVPLLAALWLFWLLAEAASAWLGSRPRLTATASIALLSLSLLALAAAAHAAEQTNPQWASEQATQLERVQVRAERVSTLPSVIPTTIEGISKDELREKVNATDSADALKYFPSLLVRKRYIGDYDHAVLSTRASGTGNSARSLVYADGILLSNLLGNGASFTPRWGMVTPEEIERVDVLYGPFSAAYAGNSVGAVVDYITRMPSRFEAHAKLGVAQQHFKRYQTDQTFRAGQGSVSLGDRAGDWAWWVSVSRQDSQSHPLVYSTRTPSPAGPAEGAVPVTGAVGELNRFNQPWLLLGSSNQADTVQDHAKLKLSWSLNPTLKASALWGLWDNTVSRQSESWLRDQSGARVMLTPSNLPVSGSWPVSLDGKGYSLNAADFGQTRERLQHTLIGLAIKQAQLGGWDWQIALSRYDYASDQVRAWVPTTGASFNPNAGRLTDQGGTGWTQASAKAGWRGWGGHRLEFGAQQDAAQLRTQVSPISEWTAGRPSSPPTSRFEGNTRLRSLWAQDAWDFAPGWRAVLGLRAENWQATRGLTANGLATHRHPERSESQLSPKAALGWQFSPAAKLSLSTGAAYRFPTVSELFQGVVNASTGAISQADPNLKPERSQTSEWSLSGGMTRGSWRTTLFHESTSDALYSQTNTTVTPNVSNIQNIDRIETWGVEWAGTWAAAAHGLGVKGVELSANLTYADSVIKANRRFAASVGKQQPRVPRWRANVLATWRVDERLSATFGLRHGGKQFNTLDNTDPNGARYQGVSAFRVMDARLHWRFDTRWSASLGVDNLGQALYWNFHPYPARTWLGELRFDW